METDVFLNPTLLKKMEGLAKRLLALVLGLLFARPGRARRARRVLGGPPRRVLLVRPDNRVGEALLTTPLLDALKALPSPPVVHVLLHQRVARVLKGHPSADAVLALDRRWLLLGPLAPGIRPLRAARYDLVVDCGNWETPSVTSAIVARLAAPAGALIGPRQWPVTWLQDVSVAPRPDTRSESLQRQHLLSPVPGVAPCEELSFRSLEISERLAAFLKVLPPKPYVVLNPGGRLGWRCVPAVVFAHAAAEVHRLGGTPIVSWGPGEESLASAVKSGSPGCLLAPPTSLDELAALMAGARFTVCNNTGPMHLSVAVHAPTLALFLHMDVERWGHPGPRHRMLDLTTAASSPDEMTSLVRSEVTALWHRSAAGIGSAPTEVSA